MRGAARFAAAALATAALVSVPASAIIVRHDAPPERYRAQPADIPALADMPGSGHGVLIAPEWVLTVAHTVAGEVDSLRSVEIAGRQRAVAQVILHPDYTPPPGVGPDGSVKPIMDASFVMRDIALVRLREPVTDVVPVTLFDGVIGEGDVLTLFGKGQGGTGLTGAMSALPQRGSLRRARNAVSQVLPEWIGVTFDRGAAALPDEGSIGRGDSGGPLMIETDDGMKLVALASWTYWEGPAQDFRAGAYGLTTYHTRVAAFRDWISQTMENRA
ncbi:MAG: trypsin-like serine protease [Erythrobacter sp.]|nr:trypsin-like serine protease [Erythrobacter sp.]NCQ65117.1 trypsin-like serine protease [Alphaproteobacteria bacterium]